MRDDPDAIVIGSGPNGLVAAIDLARAGMSVLVLEANASPGGAVRSAELTLPGFVHDVGAAFFPFGEVSPALKPLELDTAGLRFAHAEIESAHPAPDGTCASISRDPDAVELFGGLEEDGRTWREIALWHRETRQEMLELLLSPLPPMRAAIRFGSNMLRLMEVAMSSGRAWSAEHFRAEAARRVVPGLALHTDIAPDDACGAAVGFVLAVLASSSGFGVPEGGSGAITRALLEKLDDEGGEVRTDTRVQRILTRKGEAVAVRTERADEISATRCIVADVAAPSLYLDLLEEDDVPPRIRAAMREFPQGFGTFKMDWALDGPCPFAHPDAARAAVVHAGDSVDDIQRVCNTVRDGELPERPYLVIGQQSLADPKRAPEGKHTLWTYARVPSQIEGGWARHRDRYADVIEARIEELAPGFRQRILARAIHAPPDLEAQNENLIGGDLGGGSARIRHQLFFRPVFPYFRYRTPVKRLYLGSSYTHPGAGVHGACGHNAARAALRDLG